MLCSNIKRILYTQEVLIFVIKLGGGYEINKIFEQSSDRR